MRRYSRKFDDWDPPASQPIRALHEQVERMPAHGLTARARLQKYTGQPGAG